MIKANELRIGNWVEDVYPYDGQYFKVRWDNIGKVSENGHPYRPIPLTPEILEKCGFIRDENIQNNFSYVLELRARMKLVYYKADSSCLSIYQDNKLIDFSSGICKYLHQLQNLYFALTDEELEINL